MANKAEIKAAIQEKLTGSEEDLTWERHEEFLIDESDSIVENFYGVSTTDTNASTNIVTEVSSGKVYNLRFFKQGGKVTVSGTIRNATGAAIGLDETWFDITNTEYEQLTGSNVYEVGHSAGTGEPIRFTLTTNTLGTFDAIGVNETININFTYDTNA